MADAADVIGLIKNIMDSPSSSKFLVLVLKIWIHKSAPNKFLFTARNLERFNHHTFWGEAMYFPKLLGR